MLYLDHHLSVCSVVLRIIGDIIYRQQSACGNVCLAKDIHSSKFVVIRKPFLDGIVADLSVGETAAGRCHLGAHILLEVGSSDHVAEVIPLLGAGVAAAVDVDVVILAERLAGISVGRGDIFERHSVRHAAVRNASVVVIGLPLAAGETDHEVLHRAVHSLADAVALSVKECCNYGHSQHDAGTGISYGDAALNRLIRKTCSGDHNACMCSDRVESRIIPVRSVLGKALEGGVDDAGVELFAVLIGEAEFVHGAGSHILYDHVALFDKLLKKLEAFGILCVAGDRFFVHVHNEEAVGIDSGLRLGITSQLAFYGALNFENFRAEPCKSLCADCAGLKLCHIKNFVT